MLSIEIVWNQTQLVVSNQQLTPLVTHPGSVGCCLVLAVLLQTGELLYKLSNTLPPPPSFGCPLITLSVLLVCFELKVTSNMYTIFSASVKWTVGE